MKKVLCYICTLIIVLNILSSGQIVQAHPLERAINKEFIIKPGEYIDVRNCKDTVFLLYVGNMAKINYIEYLSNGAIGNFKLNSNEQNFIMGPSDRVLISPQDKEIRLLIPEKYLNDVTTGVGDVFNSYNVSPGETKKFFNYYNSYIPVFTSNYFEEKSVPFDMVNYRYSYYPSGLTVNTTITRFSLNKGEDIKLTPRGSIPLTLYVPRDFELTSMNFTEPAVSSLTVPKNNTLDIENTSSKDIYLSYSTPVNGKFNSIYYKNNQVNLLFDNGGAITNLNPESRLRTQKKDFEEFTIYYPSESVFNYKFDTSPAYNTISIDKDEALVVDKTPLIRSRFYYKEKNLFTSFTPTRYDETGFISDSQFFDILEDIGAYEYRFYSNNDTIRTVFLPIEFDYKIIYERPFTQFTVKPNETLIIDNPYKLNLGIGNYYFNKASLVEYSDSKLPDKTSHQTNVKLSEKYDKKRLMIGSRLENDITISVPSKYKDFIHIENKPLFEYLYIKAGETIELKSEQTSSKLTLFFRSITNLEGDYVIYDKNGVFKETHHDTKASLLSIEDGETIRFTSKGNKQLYIFNIPESTVRTSENPISKKYTVPVGETFYVKNSNTKAWIETSAKKDNNPYDLTIYDENGALYKNYPNNQEDKELTPNYSYTLTPNKCDLTIYLPYELVECDLNNDALTDIVDMAQLSKKYNQTKKDTNYTKTYDFNKDGIIDIYDITYLARKL